MIGEIFECEEEDISCSKAIVKDSEDEKDI